MIDVRVNINHPVDEDATVITVVGYKQNEETKEIHAYQGFPDTMSGIDELSGSFHEDGWLWQPILSGEVLLPSIKFPGIWLNGFDTAIRAFTGINEHKISTAYSLARNTDERVEELRAAVAELHNSLVNVEQMAREALDNTKNLPSV